MEELYAGWVDKIIWTSSSSSSVSFSWSTFSSLRCFLVAAATWPLILFHKFSCPCCCHCCGSSSCCFCHCLCSSSFLWVSWQVEGPAALLSACWRAWQIQTACGSEVPHQSWGQFQPWKFLQVQICLHFSSLCYFGRNWACRKNMCNGFLKVSQHSTCIIGKGCNSCKNIGIGAAFYWIKKAL